MWFWLPRKLASKKQNNLLSKVFFPWKQHSWMHSSLDILMQINSSIHTLSISLLNTSHSIFNQLYCKSLQLSIPSVRLCIISQIKAHPPLHKQVPLSQRLSHLIFAKRFLTTLSIQLQNSTIKHASWLLMES